MKRLVSISVLVLLITTVFAESKVEVYYFHHTRRCVTCQAVETESKNAISVLYAKEIQEGKVKFIRLNLEEKDSKVLAKKYKIESQALIVIGRNKRIDLTDKGFLFARTRPELLKAELKKAIDPLLK